MNVLPSSAPLLTQHRCGSIKSLCGERTSPTRSDEFCLSSVTSFSSPGARIIKRHLVKRNKFLPSKGRSCRGSERANFRRSGLEYHSPTRRDRPEFDSYAYITRVICIRAFVADAKVADPGYRVPERRIFGVHSSSWFCNYEIRLIPSFSCRSRNHRSRRETLR